MSSIYVPNSTGGGVAGSSSCSSHSASSGDDEQAVRHCTTSVWCTAAVIFELLCVCPAYWHRLLDGVWLQQPMSVAFAHCGMCSTAYKLVVQHPAHGNRTHGTYQLYLLHIYVRSL